MLSRISKLCVTLSLGLSISYAASIEEVKPFVERGVALCKAKGSQACFDAFNDPNGGFIKGELYMFAYDFKGVNQALGSNPKLVGKNLYQLINGLYFKHFLANQNHVRLEIFITSFI